MIDGMTTRPRRTKTADGAAAAAKVEQAARVLRRFRQIFNAVKTHFQHVEKVSGLGGAQLWALSVIRDVPGTGVSELAQKMDIHQSTASNLVRTLLEGRFVVAKRSDADKRSVRLHVLPAGRALLRRAPGPLSGVLPGALATLDQRALARLEKDLGSLIAALDADEAAAGVPLAQLLASVPARRRPPARPAAGERTAT